MATTKEKAGGGRRRTITEIAIDEGVGYQNARENALRGLYGRVVRIGSKLYVEEATEPKPPRAA